MFSVARRARKEARARRQRTTFSQSQTCLLEAEYAHTEYISRPRRCELSERLQLSETQIKIWFQNRRAKDKRMEKAHSDQQFRYIFVVWINLSQPLHFRYFTMAGLSHPGYLYPGLGTHGSLLGGSLVQGGTVEVPQVGDQEMLCKQESSRV